jgi:hypothetical protein
MAIGESTASLTAVSGMLQRWLPPSPPLAVDDEPFWRPAADPMRRSSGELQAVGLGRGHGDCSAR